MVICFIFRSQGFYNLSVLSEKKKSEKEEGGGFINLKFSVSHSRVTIPGKLHFSYQIATKI